MIFVFLLIPWNVLADPSPGVGWLMKEPVTLFDRGMRNMEKELGRAVKNLRFPGQDVVINPITSYFFEINSITLLVFLSKVYKNFKVPQCHIFLEAIHKDLLLYAPSGTSTKNKAYFMINHWFSHEGYKKNSRPKSLSSEVAEIITIGINADHDDGSRVYCNIPFVGGFIKAGIRKPGWN